MKKLCIGEWLIIINFVIALGLSIAAVFFRFENVIVYNSLLYIALIPMLSNIVLWKLRG